MLHLTTHIEIVNNTLLPFEVKVVANGGSTPVGLSVPKIRHVETGITDSLGTTSGIDSRKTRSFSIPIPLLEDFSKDWESYGSGTITLRLNPVIDDSEKRDSSNRLLSGKVDLTATLLDLKRSPKGFVFKRADVTCRSHEDSDRSTHPFTLQVCLKLSLIDDEHVVMIVELEPRAVIQNATPLPLTVRTPMPQTYSTAKMSIEDNQESSYELEPEKRIEVFTPGPSIAILLRPCDSPVAGNALGWIEAGWVDLPLAPEFSLQDPIVSVLPFSNNESNATNGIGAEIMVVEGQKSLDAMNGFAKSQDSGNSPASPRSASNSELQGDANITADAPLTFFLTVRNYGVDHTGFLLFDQATGITNHTTRMMSSLWMSERNIDFSRSSMHHSFIDDIEAFTGLDTSRNLSRRMSPQPLGAYASLQRRRRVSLLPNPSYPIRLLQMTMDGEDGYLRTMVRSLIQLIFVS